MNIYLASDLHLDIHKLPPNVEIPFMGGILILAGDTCESRFYEKSQDLRRICKSFDKVYAIAGNHEYYHGDIYISEDIIHVDTMDIENFEFLQKEIVKLPGNVNLIAATLWTDFNKGDPLSKIHAEYGLNDYNYIKNSTKGMYDSKKLRANDIQLINKDHFQFIEKSVRESEKCIIVSHHAPLMSHASDGYANDDLNHAYASDYSEFILNNTDKIAVWAHGHTHDDKETIFGNTKVVTFARGYIPIEFECKKIYEI